MGVECVQGVEFVCVGWVDGVEVIGDEQWLIDGGVGFVYGDVFEQGDQLQFFVFWVWGEYVEVGDYCMWVVVGEVCVGVCVVVVEEVGVVVEVQLFDEVVWGGVCYYEYLFGMQCDFWCVVVVWQLCGWQFVWVDYGIVEVVEVVDLCGVEKVYVYVFGLQVVVEDFWQWYYVGGGFSQFVVVD